MAHTARGAELTEANRETQASITAAVVEAIRDLFMEIIRLDDLDGSGAEFVRRALPVVVAGRKMAYQAALKYLEAFRRVELRGLVEDEELAPKDSDRYSVDVDLLRRYTAKDAVVDWGGEDPKDDLTPPPRIAAELHSAGVVVVKSRIARGASPEEAKKRGADSVGARVVRHVADGGRAPLAAEVRTGNRGAVGYARVVDADPCPFCAMLASRGAVYRSDAFEDSNALFSGDSKFKVHDGCECTLEPVYGRSVTALPAGSAELARQWAEIASGRPDAFGYWRRFKESGTLPGEERVRSNSESVPVSKPRKRRRGKTTQQRRKQISEIDSPQELRNTLRGMTLRARGLERELAELAARGQTPDQPGPAEAIAEQLQRLKKNIGLAERRMVIIGG